MSNSTKTLTKETVSSEPERVTALLNKQVSMTGYLSSDRRVMYVDVGSVRLEDKFIDLGESRIERSGDFIFYGNHFEKSKNKIKHVWISKKNIHIEYSTPIETNLYNGQVFALIIELERHVEI